MSDDSGPAPDLNRIRVEDDVVLEAEAHLPPSPRAALVITHPHPTYGGSMHTHIPAGLFRLSRELGVAAVRFNFRGVGRSTGVHDQGVGEKRDVAAAVAAMRSAVGSGVPLGLAGWSFGADVALGIDSRSIADQALAGWLAIAAPLSIVPPEEMTAAASPLPKMMVVPEHDFRPPAEVATLTGSWLRTEITVVPDSDHFLAGGWESVADACRRFVDIIAPPRA